MKRNKVEDKPDQRTHEDWGKGTGAQATHGRKQINLQTEMKQHSLIYKLN